MFGEGWIVFLEWVRAVFVDFVLVGFRVLEDFVSSWGVEEFGESVAEFLLWYFWVTLIVFGGYVFSILSFVVMIFRV